MKIMVSRCLLGERVRYDGGHQRHSGVLRLLAQKDILVLPICPELELGLGVPRPPIHLCGQTRAPKLLIIQSGEDLTEKMQQLVTTLAAQPIDGMILKSRSPSCGIQKVKVLHGHDYVRRGRGLFAANYMQRFPMMPVVQETQLLSLAGRKRFLHKITLYNYWRQLIHNPKHLLLSKFFLAHRHWLSAEELAYFRPAVKFCHPGRRQELATELLLALYNIIDQS